MDGSPGRPTYRLAKMNLAIRGISYHLGDKAVSTFSNDQHKDLKFTISWQIRHSI